MIFSIMKSVPLWVGVLLVVNFSALRAQILFANPVAVTTTDGSQIDTLGTYVDAVGVDGLGNASHNEPNPQVAIKIGDTTFNPIFNTPDTGITFSEIGGGNDGSHSDATPFLTVLDGVAYTGDFNDADLSAVTVTLNNLKLGDLYQVQVFQDGGFETTVTGADSVDLTGSYTIGQFTAEGTGPLTSQTFTYSNDGTANGGTSGIGAVNAIVLRDVTDLPEPSAYALMGLGLAAMVVAARVRQLAA
jgi:hypothetical protein